jgi:hypothetical protein
MSVSTLSRHSVESYMTGQGKTGYYLLAQDEEGRWYWGSDDVQQPDPSSAVFHGPCPTRGEAIIAGEDWVEAVTSI